MQVSFEHSAPAPSAMRRWVVIPAAFTVLAAVTLVTVDLPIARLCAPRNWPDEIHRYLRSIEPFGTVHGQGMLLLGLFCVLPALRKRIPRIAAAAVSAGLMSNVIKLVIGRQRPKYFDMANDSAVDAFAQFLPLLHDGVSLKSFPSAHTASAAAFAVLLSHFFPRGKWLFAITASLVAVQRIEVCEHFLSDVLIGAAVGWLVGQSFLHTPVISQWFDRFERGPHASSGATEIAGRVPLEFSTDSRTAA